MKPWARLTGDERVALVEAAAEKQVGFADESAHVRSALEFSARLRKDRANLRARFFAWFVQKRGLAC